ncbi:MAG: 3-dehydroquinate synthase [Oscillospiraceae bacterium]|nr:3-dehydroquinate synthase [Oscillospiraceae bacterium]
MNKITVNASKTYDITIGTDILNEAGQIIRRAAGGQTAAVVADDNVFALYGQQLCGTLLKNGYRVVRYIFKNGESSKTAETFIALLNFFAEQKLHRTDAAVALGGGVAGDLTGFAASCYMRGIKLVQIPTTLTAMTDSSIGGKTAVNLAAGKNLAGSFYQPDAVICDVSLLSTLSGQTLKDGYAEVIKYGMIADSALFEMLFGNNSNNSEEIITRCIKIKRGIVTEDEYETGRRKILNFGHTAGHALELLSGYTIPHGRAVAAGMAVETRAAVHMGICSADTLEQLLRLLRLYELPENTDYGADSIAEACLSDKKREGESLTMIFPAEIGKCVLKKIPAGELEAVIRSGL